MPIFKCKEKVFCFKPNCCWLKLLIHISRETNMFAEKGEEKKITLQDLEKMVYCLGFGHANEDVKLKDRGNWSILPIKWGAT